MAYATGGHVYSGTEGVARALCASNEFQFYPVVVIWTHVAKQHRNVIYIVDDDVDLAVVEQISEGGATGRSDDRQASAFDRGYHLELSILQVVKQQRARIQSGR